jgi:single-stranded DNA-binding protein
MLVSYGEGWVAGDPRSRQIGDKGNVTANVNVAFRRSYKTGGKWREETTFVNCRCFGKLAKRLATVKKGDAIAVKGHISTEKLDDMKNQPSLCLRGFSILVATPESSANTSEPAAPPMDSEAGTEPADNKVPPSTDEDAPF